MPRYPSPDAVNAITKATLPTLPTKTVKAIDYEFTFMSGKDLQFTLRPDLGDTEAIDGEFQNFEFGQTKHHVSVRISHVAVVSRRERDQVILDLPEPKEAWTPSTTTASKS